MSATDYAETAALLAVLNEDTEEADRIIGDMLPSERSHFAFALMRLTDRVRSHCDHCHKYIESGSPAVFGPRVTLHTTCVDAYKEMQP